MPVLKQPMGLAKIGQSVTGQGPPTPERKTAVSIRGDDFLINECPTYEGREWQGHRVEGLLLNSRMVQATFDDESPKTQHLWAYPDTGQWDPERNTREFVAAMPEWRQPAGRGAHLLQALPVRHLCQLRLCARWQPEAGLHGAAPQRPGRG